MSTLPTNYVDAVLNAEVNTRRRFNLIDNGDGTVSLEDVTDYTRVGSNYGAQDINNQNAEINQINTNLTALTTRAERGDFGMKVIKSGVINSTTTIDLTEFGFTSANDYSVHINGSGQGSYNVGSGGLGVAGIGAGVYVSARSATSVTITLQTVGNASYEILK